MLIRGMLGVKTIAYMEKQVKNTRKLQGSLGCIRFCVDMLVVSRERMNGKAHAHDYIHKIKPYIIPI